MDQGTEYSIDVLCSQLTARAACTKMSHEQFNSVFSSTVDALSLNLRFFVELAQERGASTWLFSLPICEHGFVLHKAAFRDALAFHYGWPPPTDCACEKDFLCGPCTFHRLCLWKDFLCGPCTFLFEAQFLFSSQVRDITANFVSEVCSNVCVEPTLQPLSGESFPVSTNTTLGARLDVTADALPRNGLILMWGYLTLK